MRFLPAIFASVLVVVSAVAHPISISHAVVNVREAEALVELKIMLEDLVMFHGLKADKTTRFAAKDLRKAAVKHQQFLADFFTIRDANGTRVPGKVIRVNDMAITDEGTFQTELMKQQVIYLMQFKPKAKQPFLTFMQNFGGKQAVLPAIMDFMVLQKGVWMGTPVQLLASRPHTVKFDWINPPTKPPANWRELKKQREEDFNRRLGITSYSGIYSYIYLTDQEVRHEILVPLLSFEKWLKLERKNPDFLEVVEQERAKNKIEAFFQDRNPMEINGLSVKPQLARLNFFGLDINDFALNAKPRRVGVYQARLGIILAYPSSQTTRTVKMEWDTFNQHAPFLRSVVYVHDNKPKEHFFVKDKALFEWKNPKPKVAQPVTAVKYKLGERLSEEDAKLVFKQLHGNIYRAFDFREDRAIYNALASGVDGDLLRALYLQFKRSLLMAEQGGARSRVQEVKIVAGKMKPKKSSFTYDCTWRVTGTVEHWGHIHTRENEYEGTFAISSTQTGWKITDYDLHRQKRLKYETGLRAFDMPR
jgi:hypothetical protein